jgi:GNAT superfamily N-acetyltransferase
MSLRRASAADAATLAALNTHVQSWHAAEYPDVFFDRPDPEGLMQWFADRLADPACTAFLVGDPPSGYAFCSLQSREASVFSPAIRRLMVDHIGVAPEARRQGHGRRLLEAARDLARDLGVDEILLDTWEANTEAHAFFRAAGFSPRRMLFRATP